MTQNRSTAVMQRRVEPHDSLDDFPTPPWATRALLEELERLGEDLPRLTVREPAANRGYMARPLAERFGAVEASDVHDYGAGYAVRDYLFPPAPGRVDWTITNPPFRLAEAFIDLGLRTSQEGVAVLVRSAFLEGCGRHARLFSLRPPTLILQFAERVVIHRGRVTADGATATAYCWLVWMKHLRVKPAAEFRWIAPCRARLERPGDYDLPGGAP